MSFFSYFACLFLSGLSLDASWFYVQNEPPSFSLTGKHGYLYIFFPRQKQQHIIMLILHATKSVGYKRQWESRWNEGRPTSTCTACFYPVNNAGWSSSTLRSICSLIQPHGGSLKLQTGAFKMWDTDGVMGMWVRQVTGMTTAEIYTKTGTTTKAAARRRGSLPFRQLLRDFQLFHFP